MFCGDGQARDLTETKHVCCAGSGVLRKLFEERAYLEMLLRPLPNGKHKRAWKHVHYGEALLEVN